MKDMPENSLEFILASLKVSTYKQYDSALKKWWRFCTENNCNPYSAEVPQVVKFLAAQCKNGAAHGSLNSTRSAISLILGPHIGEDFRVKRFFQGVFNSNPPRPKYNITWDPKIVLDYFKREAHNEELDLERLTKKLITLLAVITAHRMQTFSLIEVVNIETLSDKIIIKIPKTIKTSGKNRMQPVLVIPFFKEDCKVCAGKALVSYLDRTGEIRKDSEKFLFISFKKPHKGVNAQTLSRWVT